MNDQDLIRIRGILDFLDKISVEDRNKLLNGSKILSLNKGEAVQDGTGRCRGLIIVLEGSLRAYMLSEAGREITLYRLWEDDVCIMSASCALKDMSYEIMIDADRYSRLFLIPSAVYGAVNETNMEVQKFTSSIVASRFSEVMWVMEQVLFTSFDKRLAVFLTAEADDTDSDTISLTHDVIARHLGSAREVVTRMLKYFKNEGMIELKRGVITITDRERLRRFGS